MKNTENYASQLQALREKAGISQSKLAEGMGVAASKISRLESGELALNSELAVEVARAIGTAESRAFADYVEMAWHELERPWFSHPSRKVLEMAERALQRLQQLTSDPDVKNSFLKQVNSCGSSLRSVADNLFSTEHQVVYIGKPGVGKTTAICSEAELRDKEESTLAKQMVFQTGSGRSTVGEVHVRYGSDFSISVTPCDTQDIELYVKDMAEDIWNSTHEPDNDSKENKGGNSAEIDRLLRNMTGLKKERRKEADGSFKTIDPAIMFTKDCEDREQVFTKLWERLELPKRRRTSIAKPVDSTESGLGWVSKMFKAINLGNHPEVSVPDRVEVTLPKRIFDCKDFDIRLIDTRGVDEPSAPRRDLQCYLDDDRTVIVLCSDFVSAPDATVQSIIERCIKGGTEQTLLDRGSILVVTKEGEDKRVADDSTGEEVDDREIGRAIRREQMNSTTLKDLGISGLPIRFLDVQEDRDCSVSRSFIVDQLCELRRKWESQAKNLVETVDKLIANKADEQMKEAMESAFAPILKALEMNRKIRGGHQGFHEELLSDIKGIRYAATLRASVNRRGEWVNFNYWHGLGRGAKQSVYARLQEQVVKIRGVIETQVESSKEKTFGSFIVHFQQLFEEHLKKFLQWVEQVGETAFFEQFRSDLEYWQKAMNRWGGGKGDSGMGYKGDIAEWTKEWFRKVSPAERASFLDAEIGLRWNNMIEELEEVLTSTGVESAS